MSWWERQWYKMLGGNVTVAGALRGATVTADNLTAGRVTFATTGGQLADDGDLTFATDTLTATKAQVTSQARFGDTSTNYTNFDNTGHQTIAGTGKPWEDLRIEPVARTTGAAAPSFEAWFGTLFLYSFDDGATPKEIYFSMQMPHQWDFGSINIHVHWVGSHNDTTAAPLWRLDYAWKSPGEVFSAVTIAYGLDKVPVDANITAGKHYLTTFLAISPGTTANGLSSILIGRLMRENTHALDTYDVAGNKCGLLYIDAHYQINSLGSTDEYTK